MRGPWLAFCVGVPLAWAVVLAFHPFVDSEDVYTSLSDQADRWLVVHLLTLVFIGLMGLAMLRVLRDLTGVTAQLARLSTGVFVLFYGSGEALLGVGTGVLVR